MTAPAYPNLHRIAYGEGARLTAEARVEAADALERLGRRCDGCFEWTPSFVNPDSHGRCAFSGGTTYPHDACTRWRCNGKHLTPAHDKEKS